ncbi:interleukin-17 receptor D isoform X2 [Mastacembelus armatus]|uniref:interleukin-17 receptor D isoform X2 n=1 Tax=Mastacembelus armatus TaxID=205130 RepID=UPI000E457AA9|nr:interleukin-17 receptor D-like isoform X2 [Mastacembelus armatus]
MWTAAIVLYQVLAFGQPLWAQDGAITPQKCSLDCVREGGPECEYCSISRADVEKALGFNSIKAFGGCIPWPCFELLGKEDPQICQHYVQAPNDVKIEFVHEPNPKSDTIVVSWKPSYYGIAFLRGFQVSLQALGGSSVACQLLLFHRNHSLSASHAQMVYKSDPFPGLSLGSQYAVTVMALPVPEEWAKFYQSKIFSTRSCAEKNSLEQCRKDWYPKFIAVKQDGTTITVTFNLAPPDLGITSYFSLCHANGEKKYTEITPKSSINKTHHSYELHDLHEGTNYTCQIAANEVDAVRKTFSVQVLPTQKDTVPLSVTASLALMFPLCLAVLILLAVFLAALTTKLQIKKLYLKPDIIKQHHEDDTQENVASLPRNGLDPPRLLICYSSYDGPAHVKAVMKLGAFIQQHMATQVFLDLWDSLSVAEEGAMAWYCRQIRESDFVLVICSWGLNHRPCPPEPEVDDDDVEGDRQMGFGSNCSNAVVQLIGEEVGRAKARGQDLSKYMAGIFEYSEETDIPTELRLVSHYKLTNDLTLLFSHLHGVALHRPGGYLKINHISDEGFSKLPAGAALQSAISAGEMAMRAKQHHWEEGSE